MTDPSAAFVSLPLTLPALARGVLLKFSHHEYSKGEKQKGKKPDVNKNIFLGSRVKWTRTVLLVGKSFPKIRICS